MSVFKKMGTDCEFFVSHRGEIGSAIGLIGGSKNAPLLVENGNLQEDNVLAEMATDPCATLDEWLTKISSVRVQLGEKLEGYELVCKSSHHYTKQQLLSYPADAMKLGCTADYNIYSNKNNPTPNAKTVLRTAAGHIHYSYDNPSVSTTINIAKCLDATLGLWSVITDNDRHRRLLYGKAGCIRFKEYGGEYRTLGNFWLANTARQTYVWKITKMCVEQHHTLLPMLRAIVSEEAIQAIINDSDRERALLLTPAITRIVSRMLSGDEEYERAA